MTFRSKVFYKNIKGTLYQFYLVIYLLFISNISTFQYMSEAIQALAYELVAGPEFNLKQTTLA